eukprot:PITA_03088
MDVVRVFVNEVIRLHRLPTKIISDRDSRFTSRFWTSLQSALGTQLNLSTAYHPETNGKTERVNQVLEDMLRMYIMDNQTQWERYLPLVEFAYNNNYHSSIGVPPYQALYGRHCRTPLSWEKLEDRVIVGPELVQEMEEQDLQVLDMGTVMVEPLRILDRRVRQLRHRTVDQVKVQWDKYSPGSATWEDAETTCRDYPSLFEHL